MQSPNPYKTCRLFVILKSLSQKDSQNPQETITFISIPWHVSPLVETLIKPYENNAIHFLFFLLLSTSASGTYLIKPVVYWWFWSPLREKSLKNRLLEWVCAPNSTTFGNPSQMICRAAVSVLKNPPKSISPEARNFIDFPIFEAKTLDCVNILGKINLKLAKFHVYRFLVLR